MSLSKRLLFAILFAIVAVAEPGSYKAEVPRKQVQGLIAVPQFPPHSTSTVRNPSPYSRAVTLVRAFCRAFSRIPSSSLLFGSLANLRLQVRVGRNQ